MRRIRFNILRILSLTALSLMMPSLAQADAPGLQIRPLQYEDKLVPGHVKTGFIEVANPGDSVLSIHSSVRGFRQTGTDGSLEFFDDADLAAGIKVDLTDFVVGPREAIRVSFNVDPAKLPPGGIYAAIFFRTVSPVQAPQSSYVSQSANIGTLLELTNGPAGLNFGSITKVDLKFWQFGQGLMGSLNYKNTDTSPQPHGFKPALTVQVLPWGFAPILRTGLVLPGTTRQFRIIRSGSYFGFLPVIVTDSDTHHTALKWIFACTGWWQWVMLVLIFASGFVLIAQIFKNFKRKPRLKSRRSIDGLSPKR